MQKTDSRPAFVRRDSVLVRIAQLDAQLDALVAAKAEARAALAEIERECGEEPTKTDNLVPEPGPGPSVFGGRVAA
jgi:hypothetical protein